MADESIVRRWLSGLGAEAMQKLLDLSEGEPSSEEVLSWDFAALGIDLSERARLQTMTFFNAPKVDERYVRFVSEEYRRLQDVPVRGNSWELLSSSEPLRNTEHHAVAALGRAMIAVNPSDASAPVLLVDEDGAQELAAHFDDLVSHLKGS